MLVLLSSSIPISCIRYNSWDGNCIMGWFFRNMGWVMTLVCRPLSLLLCRTRRRCIVDRSLWSHFVLSCWPNIKAFLVISINLLDDQFDNNSSALLTIRVSAPGASIILAILIDVI